ncbi:hypothetical protein K435DRAFT_774753 [Dendrothele bispora CBS 962.96]|uniref:Uncharacterized protein n=1 Tax=Dendrothele bispora (strain CBS 962.96) TaxID=1314807 RepID=A0A4S8MLW0_DENBC|nr:hypothetical protein K435DRAFT_774753 [Dendrothele bispora CBS 962.96]
MSEMNNPGVSIGSPRVLSSRNRHSRAASATSPRHQGIPSSSSPLGPHDPDGDLRPNVETLYNDDGNDFNVDPNAPVLSGAVGEETMKEVERQKEQEEQERKEKYAARAEAGRGNRFVGGFVLRMKNALRPRWDGNSPQRQTEPPRDPYPAFPHAVYDPEPEDDGYDVGRHDRLRGQDPRDVEYHAGTDRRESEGRGLPHRSSESLGSPSETVHPTTEWHDDGTTAVDHSGYPPSQYPDAYGAYGNPVPPQIPPNMQQDPRIHQNNINPSNPDGFHPSDFPTSYNMPPQSNYIPANSAGLYNYTFGSPVLADIKPASDYAKMDIPPSTAPSDVSLNTYFSRIRQAVEHINSLPWVSERVTVDYYPAGIRREKITRKEKDRERLKRQDEEKLGPGGLSGEGRGIGRKDRRPIISWYDRSRIGLPTSNPGEIDLTAGSPPRPVMMQPSMAQTMSGNPGAVTPYSPLAAANIPPVAIVPSVAPSGVTTGTTPRPIEVPLAPGLYPSTNAEVSGLVPASSEDPNSFAEDGASPGGAGMTVRLSSTGAAPPLPTFTQQPPQSNVPVAGTPATDPVPINVVPPSTSMPSASADAMNSTAFTSPGMGMSALGPVMPEPPAARSPPHSTTHTRTPSAPVNGTPMIGRASNNPMTSPAPPSQTHSRTPSRTHQRAPSSTGGYTSNRRYNPNTPVHYFPANVPATSAPPRTPAPTAPPTPVQPHNTTLAQQGSGRAPIIPTARQISQSGYSDGGISDRSGKSGFSAKTGRSWVVVNGAASPSSTTTDNTRDNRDFGTPYIPTRVNSVAATPRIGGRRETMDAPVTPMSVNQSSQFQTPVVSMYGESGYGHGYDRKGKGKVPPRAASVQTVSDSEDGSSSRKAYREQQRIYSNVQRQHYQQMENDRARGLNPNYAMGVDSMYPTSRLRQP